MKTILLTSSGLSSNPVRKAFIEVMKDRPKGPVALVTTASPRKEKSPWTQMAQQEFLDLGFEQVDFVDIKAEPKFDFSPYQIIFVCGGNTFYLQKYSRLAGFEATVRMHLANGGTYMGESAGSIIATPTTRLANTVAPDPNEVKTVNFTGFKLVPFEIFPHYEKQYEAELQAYEQEHGVKVERLTDDQALFILDDSVIRIG
ncbi:MAG TPA: Type 1 glutamine amidotransferase-like domain-containing protein [Patescibacteria group bacterium]